MKTARETIAAELRDNHCPDPHVTTSRVLFSLEDAGYQIVPPGGVHEPTREAAAKSLECLLPEFGGMKPPTDETDRMVDAARREAALFIRSLEATHGE